MDLQCGDGGGLRELALFAGAGGGILAGQLCGDRTVCAVEWDAYAAGVLVRQQNAGHLPPFPVWDDVCTFDGRPWRGVADCVSGGFPCQDISVAGGGAGLDGDRSGLWREFARVVREVEPSVVRVENSPMLTSRGLGVVLGDLAALGFDAWWDVLSAADTGAPHLRDRIWIVASHPNRLREQQRAGGQQEFRGRVGDGAAEPPDADCSAGEARRQVEHKTRAWANAGRSLEVDANAGSEGLQVPERQELRGERGGGSKGEQLPNTVGGPLNPDWCEWFMGFPVGWTASSASATARYHEWLLQHGICWAMP